MTAARHLAVVRSLADVIPLPQHGGIQYTPLAHQVLRLAAQGFIARSSVPGGRRVTVGGTPAGTLASEIAALVAAGLLRWITYSGGEEIATATLRGAQVLTSWDSAPGPEGDAA